MNIFLVVLFMLFTTSSVQASDLAKEKRWAEQTVDSILDGEDIWLKAGNLKFLSIYTEAEDESSKGIIVVHGTGIHPNWDQVVKPVRVEMTMLGWNTLSVQMPILANEATYDDYVPLYPEVPARLKAAEDYLLSQGIKNIVIVAHSQGSTMSAYYLANNDHKVSAFVAIGMQATQKDVDINAATSLKAIDIPVLDLYGSKDLPGVLETVNKKKQASSHNKTYQQQGIMGAEHFFDDKNEELIEAINNWLNQLK
mgnify:CR=1 FL=1